MLTFFVAIFVTIAVTIVLKATQVLLPLAYLLFCTNLKGFLVHYLFL